MDIKLKPRIAIINPDSTFLKNHHFVPNSTPLFNTDSTRFSHFVANEKVFILPQDNMPCLKPNTGLVYNMPVLPTPGNSNMPNGFQQPKEELLQSLRKQFLKEKK